MHPHPHGSLTSSVRHQFSPLFSLNIKVSLVQSLCQSEVFCSSSCLFLHHWQRLHERDSYSETDASLRVTGKEMILSICLSSASICLASGTLSTNACVFTSTDGHAYAWMDPFKQITPTNKTFSFLCAFSLPLCLIPPSLFSPLPSVLLFACVSLRQAETHSDSTWNNNWLVKYLGKKAHE